METADRVRANTSEEINRRIDEDIETRIREYSTRSRSDITRRIGELDREWDMERLLETNASAVAFTGLALGLTHNKKWLIVPGIVLPFLFQHAVQGWCPPVPVTSWILKDKTGGKTFKNARMIAGIKPGKIAAVLLPTVRVSLDLVYAPLF